MKTNSPKFRFVAKTLFGLEDILSGELNGLGASEIKKLHRAVSFSGDLKLMYEANLHLRSALRILKRIYSFKARNESELYKGVQDVFWDKYFSYNNTIAVDSAVNSGFFNHSQYASQKVKDAIVDQLRSKFGKRPSIDLQNPDFRINVHIQNETCTLYLDSSNESLHKRGYRLQMSEAPMSEVLAAGLVLLSGWKGQNDFIDPMCGSGTILIEAAMIAKKIPPGIFRKQFGFFHWQDFDKSLWEKVLQEARANISKLNCKITGLDNSVEAVEIAKKNILNAGFSEEIHIKLMPFENFNPEGSRGTLIMNPPYGERIKQNDIVAFYKSIGDTLKKKYSGHDCWILSSNMDAMKFIGLHPSKKISLMNGPLECKFQKYLIYAGSKKAIE